MSGNTQHTIEITVMPDGGTRIEAKGFTGVGCVDATRQLEQALGIAQQRQLTSDYHRTNQSDVERARQQP